MSRWRRGFRQKKKKKKKRKKKKKKRRRKKKKKKKKKKKPYLVPRGVLSIHNTVSVRMASN